MSSTYCHGISSTSTSSSFVSSSGHFVTSNVTGNGPGQLYDNNMRTSSLTTTTTTTSTSTSTDLTPTSNSYNGTSPQTRTMLSGSLQSTATINGNPSDQLKGYDYLLKFLLVGDPDVGKDEIMNSLDSDISGYEQNFSGSPGVAFKSTQILLDGRRIRLQLWDASGQGRFSTIIRSYSRGAQGILLVYDITNKWSFSGLKRWLREVEEHAPGVPKILIGNRLHLAFQRQVNEHSAESYAQRYNMSFFEVSPLCNYNIRESFAELSRMVLRRNGMENVWRRNTVLSLRELCCRSIVACTTVYGVEQLPLPPKIKCYLKSYSSLTSYTMKSARSYTSRSMVHSHKYKDLNSTLRRKAKALFSCDTYSKSPTSNRLHLHNHFRSYNSTHVDYHQKNCVIS